MTFSLGLFKKYTKKNKRKRRQKKDQTKGALLVIYLLLSLARLFHLFSDLQGEWKLDMKFVCRMHKDVLHSTCRPVIIKCSRPMQLLPNCNIPVFTLINNLCSFIICNELCFSSTQIYTRMYRKLANVDFF